jgi:hypothetical protein
MGEGGGLCLYVMSFNAALNYWDYLGKLPNCSDCPDCSSEQTSYDIADVGLTSSNADLNFANTAVTSASNAITAAQGLACVAGAALNPACWAAAAAAAVLAINARAGARNALDVANVNFDTSLTSQTTASTQYNADLNKWTTALGALTTCNIAKLNCLGNCCP